MKTQPATPNVIRRRRKGVNALLALAALLLALFIIFVHPFLAVTRRVDADILVVEGWIPDYMFPTAAREFRENPYNFLLISGLQNDPADTSGTAPEFAHAAAELKKLGVPAQQIVECPTPFARWLRTSKTSRAVRAKADALKLREKGVNVITAGPHARETWVAYEHAFGNEVPVGIISIPKKDYPADRWWLSRRGLIWVPKDFVAWVKEVLFGLRS